MKKIKILEHTADIGIEVRAKTLPKLIEYAAAGMFGLLADLKKVTAKKRINLTVTGIDPEDLLINWLNELLYLQAVKKVLLKKFNVLSLRLDPKKRTCKLKAEVFGEKYNPAKQTIEKEIKAATRHQLEIKHTKNGYKVKIYFDI